MVLWDGPRLQKRIQSRTGNNTLLKVLILGTLNQESKTLILALLQKEILVSSSERAKNGNHICNKADATFLPSRHFSLLPHHLLFPPHGAAGSRAAHPGLALCTAQSTASLSRPWGLVGHSSVGKRKARNKATIPFWEAFVCVWWAHHRQNWQLQRLSYS